jgi:hypothetical protein
MNDHAISRTLLSISDAASVSLIPSALDMPPNYK